MRLCRRLVHFPGMGNSSSKWSGWRGQYCQEPPLLPSIYSGGGINQVTAQHCSLCQVHFSKYLLLCMHMNGWKHDWVFSEWSRVQPERGRWFPNLHLSDKVLGGLLRAGSLRWPGRLPTGWESHLLGPKPVKSGHMLKNAPPPQASPCLADPCRHGSCLATSTTTYQCQCQPGYSGKR